MRKLIHLSLPRVLALLCCCITMAVQARVVNIQGYTSEDTYNGQPLFFITHQSITVSLNLGYFYYVLIDDSVIKSPGNGMKSETLSISDYFDGNIHKLELVESSSSRGICYFRTYDASKVELIDGVEYVIVGDEVAVAGSTEDIEVANILATYSKDGVSYPVTTIYASAFANRTKLQSATIPNSVTSIGSYAFSDCYQLQSVSIPNSVTSIGAYTFYNCRQLQSVSIPNSVTSIGSSTFSNCYQLQSVSIPNTVTSIGSDAFYKCEQLQSVTIPEAITFIGERAFYACYGLETLNFNAVNCTRCGSSRYPAFPTSISTLTIGDNVTLIPDYFLYNGSRIQNLNIPNSVTSIGKYAFYGLLESITFGSGLVSIANDAFYGCTIVKAFWLGNTPPTCYENVKPKINYVANNQYSSLPNQRLYQFLSSKFTVDGTVYVPVSPSERTCDVVDCIYSSSYTDIVVSDKVVNKGIEMKVNQIMPYSFYANNYIKTLELANNGGLGYNAFDKCSGLISLKATNQGSIEQYAFSGCTSLETATISNQGSIEQYAFSGCTSLKTATISNQGSIEQYAFSGCTSLKTATISNQGSIKQYVFSGCTSLETATISNQGSIEQYAFSDCTSLETALIQNHGYIGQSTFSGCSKLKTATLGEDISAVGESAFYNCSALEEITIPNSVTSLGSSVFRDCSSLSTAIIGTGVPELPTYAFSGCSSLGQITIPGNITLIGDYAFEACTKLGDISIEDAEEALRLGSNDTDPLFSDCPLDEVYIGRKLSYSPTSNKGSSPFYRNTSLRTVEITDAETQIYDNEFYGCSNLTSLKIGNGVTSIGDWAFSGCSSLDYFSSGYNVKTIGKEAFSDCTGLTKYYSYSVVPPVCGDQALDDINKWECALYVPSESRDEYQAAPQWKEFFFVEEMAAVLVAEIRLDVEELTLDVGESHQLRAEVLPANVTDKNVIWSSSDANVATVDSNGIVVAKAVGSATITVRSADGNAEASCNVLVSDSSGIGAVMVDGNAPLEVYNLNGYKVADSLERLGSGIFIVKQGTRVTKIVVK